MEDTGCPPNADNCVAASNTTDFENDSSETMSSNNAPKKTKRSNRKGRVKCLNCNAPHHEAVCEWPCFSCFTIKVQGENHSCNREWILRYYCSIIAYKKFVLSNIKLFNLRGEHVIFFLKQNKNRLDEEFQKFAIDDDISLYNFREPVQPISNAVVEERTSHEPAAKRQKNNENSNVNGICDDVQIMYEVVTIPEEIIVPRDYQVILDKEDFSVEGEEHNAGDFGELRITGFNLRLLRPGRVPNDFIMDSYLRLVVERNKSIYDFPKIFTFPVILYRLLDLPNGFSMVLDYLPDDLLQHDIILIPLLIQSHWILFVADVEKKLFFVYDSVYESNNTQRLCRDEYRRCLYLLKRFAENHQINIEIDSWKKIKPHGPLQENLIDCGICVSIFAEKYAKRMEANFNATEINEYRKRMLYELLTGKIYA